jgi:plastocyanin
VEKNSGAELIKFIVYVMMDSTTCIPRVPGYWNLLNLRKLSSYMNWKIFFVAAVVVCSGCTSFAANQDETTPPDTSKPADTQPTELETDEPTIYFTDSGFQPASITVEQGTTVTWINNASSSMWVGSNDHPVHAEYAGSSLAEHCSSGDQTTAAFDQCTTGDRFSFTFEKTGEWSYHNHEPFARGGTITVRQ